MSFLLILCLFLLGFGQFLVHYIEAFAQAVDLEGLVLNKFDEFCFGIAVKVA
jgi:hypothetical protein